MKEYRAPPSAVFDPPAFEPLPSQARDLNPDGPKSNVTEGSLSPEGREPMLRPSETERVAATDALTAAGASLEPVAALSAREVNPAEGKFVCAMIMRATPDDGTGSDRRSGQAPKESERP